jgi:hypothetical protein
MQGVIDNTRKEYLDYLKQPGNFSLFKALAIMKNGLPAYINSSGDLVPGKTQDGLGSQAFNFLKSHNVILMFTNSLSWNEHARVDEGKFIHYPDSGFKTFKASTIWISKDFRDIPIACALIIAHEYGHLLINEVKFNCADGKYPEWFPVGSNAEDKFCNTLSGRLAEELNLHLFNRDFDQLSDDAKKFVFSNFGAKAFPLLRGELYLSYRISNWVAFSAREHRCGMRCKYFDRYQYCGHRVKSPPCWQYQKHLELLTGSKPSDPSK